MIILAIIRYIVLILAYLLRNKRTLDFEKIRPFECGFIPNSKSRTPFSTHFFLIAIIFLIFDVELILLFPYFLLRESGSTNKEMFILLVVLLTWGTLVEWSQSMLDWTNFK